MKLNFLSITAIIAILIAGGAIISSLMQKPAGNDVLDTTTVKCTTTQCFHPEFLKCSPSELKMPFAEGVNSIITVYGISNMICHYDSKLEDKEGNFFQATDCMIPMYNITEDTFVHLLGEDQEGEVKAKQDKIEADYCMKQ